MVKVQYSARCKPADVVAAQWTSHANRLHHSLADNGQIQSLI